MKEEQERSELRKKIQDAMRTAPRYISGASIQVVRRYKQDLVNAHKVLRKHSATISELQATLQKISDQQGAI